MTGASRLAAEHPRRIQPGFAQTRDNTSEPS